MWFIYSIIAIVIFAVIKRIVLRSSKSVHNSIPSKLHHAAGSASDPQEIIGLLNNGYHVNTVYTVNQTTPLHWAIGNTCGINCEVSKILIDAGADINAKADNLQTPLHWATLHGKEDIINLLINEGADLKVKDLSGKTPLELAKVYNNTTAISILSLY